MDPGEDDAKAADAQTIKAERKAKDKKNKWSGTFTKSNMITKYATKMLQLKGKKQVEFEERVEEEINDYEDAASTQDAGTTKIQPDALREILARLAIEIDISGPWNKQVFEIDKIPNVPRNRIDDYAAALKRRGIDVTIENIQKVHSRALARTN